jgi:hypothetical protein
MAIDPAWAVAVVGAIGIVVPAYTRRGDRLHERETARSARLHEQRLELYNEMAAALESARLYAERTHPISGPQPDPPPPPDDREWSTLWARLQVGGSAEVIAAIDAAGNGAGGFRGRVMTYEALKAQGGVPESITEARKGMDDARQRYTDAIDEAERVMRDELAGL